MVCSDKQLLSSPNTINFQGKTMGYKWVKLSKFDRFETFELNIPSDRVFSGLSENHKIIQIGPTELKLWPLKHNSHHNLSHNYVCT